METKKQQQSEEVMPTVFRFLLLGLAIIHISKTYALF